MSFDYFIHHFLNLVTKIHCSTPVCQSRYLVPRRQQWIRQHDHYYCGAKSMLGNTVKYPVTHLIAQLQLWIVPEGEKCGLKKVISRNVREKIAPLSSLEKTLHSPLDNKEIKPVNLKEVNHEYSLEGVMQKLKIQYLGYLMSLSIEPTQRKESWCCERLKIRREGDGRWWDGWMVSLIQWTWVWAKSRW